MTETRWYLRRASDGHINLHVELAEPAPARGYVAWVLPAGHVMTLEARRATRKSIAYLREACEGIDGRTYRPVRTFDPVEDDVRP